MSYFFWLIFFSAFWKEKKVFLKIAQGSAKKNRKYFPKKEKASTFDSSGSKETQESGTITLKSSFTCTADKVIE